MWKKKNFLIYYCVFSFTSFLVPFFFLLFIQLFLFFYLTFTFFFFNLSFLLYFYFWFFKYYLRSVILDFLSVYILANGFTRQIRWMTRRCLLQKTVDINHDLIWRLLWQKTSISESDGSKTEIERGEKEKKNN